MGLYNMQRGGEGAGARSNKLMRWRVALQAVAVLLLMIGMWLKRTHAG
ncbi:twin transmembrane helix small protein [Brevundimonas naejangsanensis]